MGIVDKETLKCQIQYNRHYENVVDIKLIEHVGKLLKFP